MPLSFVPAKNGELGPSHPSVCTLPVGSASASTARLSTRRAWRPSVTAAAERRRKSATWAPSPSPIVALMHESVICSFMLHLYIIVIHHRH